MRILVMSLVVVSLAAPLRAATYVVDDFDGGADARVTSRTITPDNSAQAILGSFPSSRFDVFGVTNRTVNFDFADDSVIGVGNPNELATDTFGVAPFATYPEANKFFGVEDLDNADNLGGTGTAIWTFDISGLSNLSLSAVFSAMGDFEAAGGDNSHTFTATIDGGSPQTIFSIISNDDLANNYVMESGTIVSLNDPLQLTDASGSRVITNTFTTVGTSPIVGAGSVLTLTYTAGPNNGGEEVFAFDNLVLSDEGATPTNNADFNGDNIVDGADFLIWQKGFGATGQPDKSTGDATGDGNVNGLDLDQWKLKFGGAPAVAAIGAVPEPASLTLAGLAAIFAAGAAARRR
jgi:hypothetical protein